LPERRARLLDDAEGNVASAARKIQKMKRTRALRRPELRDKRVLPRPVQPAGHQIVHNVVTARDLMEYVVDQRLLVGKRHGAKSEMGLGAVCRHHCALAGRTIARGLRGRYHRQVTDKNSASKG